jgi:fatty acid synthase subunit alpha, fungi type
VPPPCKIIHLAHSLFKSANLKCIYIQYHFLPPFASSTESFLVIDPVSTCSDQWIAAKVLRGKFIYVQSLDDVQPKVDEAGGAMTLFFVCLIGFIADCMHATSEDTPKHTACLAILLRAVSHFTTTLLSDIDIHSLVASYEHEPRKTVLST